MRIWSFLWRSEDVCALFLEVFGLKVTVRADWISNASGLARRFISSTNVNKSLSSRMFDLTLSSFIGAEDKRSAEKKNFSRNYRSRLVLYVFPLDGLLAFIIISWKSVWKRYSFASAFTSSSTLESLNSHYRMYSLVKQGEQQLSCKFF